jgi:Mg/Co/Ni transporter MgtE
VIRGLAVGSITDTNTKSYLKRELKMGTCLSFILGTAGCIRAAIFMTPMLETFAITTSLFMIVSISIILGALLPLGMKKIRIDPAHSSTTIQVIMDILGVTITVFVCRWVYWLSGTFLMDA